MENEFRGQHGITATVNDVNDSVELSELWDTGKLVDFIGKRSTDMLHSNLKRKFCWNLMILEMGEYIFPI